MKKFKFAPLLILLLWLAGLNIYGQRKEISKEEFFDAYKKTSEKGAAYRITGKSETYRDNQLKSVSNDTSEFVPPDKRRYVSEMKRFETDKTFLFERIVIGNDEYKRENNGAWTRKPYRMPVKPTNNKSGLVENNARFYLTENIELDNQAANFYELTVEYKHTTQSRLTNEKKESVSYRKEKRWISRDGFLLKMEMEDEFQEPGKTMSRRIWIYEYNSNIKIEAPKIVEQEKK